MLVWGSGNGANLGSFSCSRVLTWSSACSRRGSAQVHQHHVEGALHVALLLQALRMLQVQRLAPGRRSVRAFPPRRLRAPAGPLGPVATCAQDFWLVSTIRRACEEATGQGTVRALDRAAALPTPADPSPSTLHAWIRPYTILVYLCGYRHGTGRCQESKVCNASSTSLNVACPYVSESVRPAIAVQCPQSRSR